MDKARVLALIVLTGAVTGCTVGAPPGFSNGDRWTFPLVGPLEDGLLVTPAMVAGHGPYLFVFDPDAGISAIDKQVVDEAELRTTTGPHVIDETDTGQIRFYAEVVDFRIANLTIDRRTVMLFPVGFYDTEGRHINGIIGRDVLADSLVFGFDRDQGVAMLSTIKAFTPPPGAIPINYQAVSSTTASGSVRAGSSVLAPVATGDAGTARPSGTSMTPREGPQGRSDIDTPPVDRRLASAQIGAAKLSMHLDLGSSVSQLYEQSWAKAGLTPTKVDLRLVDEAASVRHVTSGAVAAEVEIGNTRTQQVVFVPYVERRFGTLSVDGTLGLDFFRPYSVFVNWDSKVYYVKPRGDAAAALTARLGRWGGALPSCAHPGCVSVEVSDGTLSVARDPEAADRGLEVLLSSGAQGVPPLVVELPRGADKVTSQLPADYARAPLVLADASPFPRTCVGSGGCVVPLLAPGASPPPESSAPAGLASPAPAAPAEAPAPAAPKAVALEKLHRLSGSPTIPPSADVKKAAGTAPISVAILKVCVGIDGKVESTKVIKSSGVAVYDQQLESTIQSTWAFDPVVTDGKPAPACASATFVGH